MKKEPKIIIAALYKFVAIKDPKMLQEALIKLTKEHDIFGTLLVSHEGLNGTVSGSRNAIDTLKAFFQNEGFNNLEYKESTHDVNPFFRMKVVLKKQILNLDNATPHKNVGEYVNHKQWNELILDPEVTVLDVRNDYEVQIGTFTNAVNPKTKTFSEFADFVKKTLDPQKHQKIAMSCTGGIRCEKASSFMQNMGFKEVFHLKGGVLQYLEDVNKSNTKNLWQGECFVFDQRVSVDKNLHKGTYESCYACRMPLDMQDLKSPHFKKGISCHHCFDKRSHKQKAGYEERHKQTILAKQRGKNHLGPKENRC